ncbi:ethanolamine ammonia-lyase reactivating factor EutA [Crassaminicella thermophila]|uniref:ethanolamine ammonia-lyase reactivating factor EutA n=1 Tax=Crassaminicella thermophila TaxID=2599308 RepID=UPI002FCE9A6E
MQDILSVGIDIGTSTTQLVFSKITIQNIASMAAVPRVKIVDKEVIYRSSIYFTPLKTSTEIDVVKVRDIIEKEYNKAKIIPKDVDSGAVIITGETARKENAKEVLKILSGLAGDFVVATAGPDLEAIIAGKGANASKESKDKACVVANLDIGGGTTNIAIFKNGDVIDTSCLDIGGRLIRVNKDTLEVLYASYKIKKLAESIGLEIYEGKKLSLAQLEKISIRMGEILEEALGVRDKSQELDLMVTNHDLRRDYYIDYISFSGGIADCIYTQYTEDLFKFEDIGILLGKSIKNGNLLKQKEILKATETIRATVIGAGLHTTNISGSTITFSEKVLPLKNIPILKLTEDDELLTFDRLSSVIADKLKWFRLDNDNQQVALAFKGMKNASFETIQNMSKCIIKGMEEMLELDIPLVVIIENDMAKVLGQTLKKQLKFKKDVVCIDSVKVESGDYIDIGNSLANGKVVPVIVKTLLFSY